MTEGTARIPDPSVSLVRALVLIAAAGGLAACDGDDGRNGFNSLVDIREVPVGDAQCPSGGFAVDSGLDRNRNDILDPEEITSTTFLDCEPVALALTLLHINDGESKIPEQGDFGGIDRFATVILNLQDEGAADDPDTDFPRGVVTVTSGDNTLASPALTAGFENHDAGNQVYDAIALDYIDFDAMCIGNHDFDFGPDRLADFISDHIVSQVPFLSANLDFSNETAELQGLVNSGRIAASVVVETAGEQVGIVGATTENLGSISSPRDVIINDVEQAVQDEIDDLLASGIDKIVLISHLQNINEDIELIGNLTGVDIVVAGGGDELLASPDDVLIPGDVAFANYPIVAADADGRDVPVVTTSGSYRYVGKLVVYFDEDGEIIVVNDEESGPVRVAGGNEPDAVTPDAFVNTEVTQPVDAFQADLANNVIVQSADCDVDLDGTRGQVNADPFQVIQVGVRNSETNEGNLIADSLLWQGQQLAADFGSPIPVVGIQNGGGIRNDSIISCSSDGLTELDTFNMVPFANFVSIIEIPRDQFLEVLENAVSSVEFGSGRFAQVAGFSFSYDRTGTPREGEEDGTQLTPGTRVIDVTLDDGTPIVVGGVVQPGGDIAIATIDFLARGGDSYPYRGTTFTSVGVSYQAAVFNYITAAAVDGGLEGAISAADYPEGGEGRIVDATP
jgi:5'-nucleotidase